MMPDYKLEPPEPRYRDVRPCDDCTQEYPVYQLHLSVGGDLLCSDCAVFCTGCGLIFHKDEVTGDTFEMCGKPHTSYYCETCKAINDNDEKVG